MRVVWAVVLGRIVRERIGDLIPREFERELDCREADAHVRGALRRQRDRLTGDWRRR